MSPVKLIILALAAAVYPVLLIGVLLILRRPGPLPMLIAFVAGVVLNLPGVWYLDALTDIAKSQPSVISILLQLLLFNVIMFALIEIPIVIFLIRPQRPSGLVSGAAGRTREHGRAIGVVVANVVGAYLIAHSVLHLPGGRS